LPNLIRVRASRFHFITVLKFCKVGKLLFLGPKFSDYMCTLKNFTQGKQCGFVIHLKSLTEASLHLTAIRQVSHGGTIKQIQRNKSSAPPLAISVPPHQLGSQAPPTTSRRHVIPNSNTLTHKKNPSESSAARQLPFA
jgi:hypothetical protein